MFHFLQIHILRNANLQLIVTLENAKINFDY